MLLICCSFWSIENLIYESFCDNLYLRYFSSEFLRNNEEGKKDEFVGLAKTNWLNCFGFNKEENVRRV